MKNLARTALLALGLALAACGDDSSGPATGGLYTATLTGPAGTLDGAAVIELTGSGIDTVTALEGQLFMHRSGTSTRVVVIRDTPGQIDFTVHLAPGSRTPTASVLEVSDAHDQLRASLANYRVRFAR